MKRLQAISIDQATGKAKELLSGVKAELGRPPNLLQVMANSPAVLDAYLRFSAALQSGELSAKDRERIALAVGEANACEYCLSAHSAIAKSVGLTPDQIVCARQARQEDSRTEALLRFARAVVDHRGEVSDESFEAVRGAGWSDGEIAEVVANVALNIFTNYINHVAGTEIDFPIALPLEATNSGCCSKERACAA
ncbi:MAG: hypothetical protein GHCLOJNM_02073 [bacterium]|nr:hypothetical protein [bacterium]